jgi:hypothetical protein
VHAVLVAVDTNVLGVDPPLAGNAMQRLLDSATQGDIRLAVPDLVIREAANAWALEVTEQLRLAEKASRRLSALGVRSRTRRWPSPDKLRADKEAELREQLQAANALVPPLPQGGHVDIVERALRRAKPFDANGRDGYRDTLLWETILTLAANEDVIFVSRDVRAYFENNHESGIDKRLAAELKKRCGRTGAVRLFFGLDKALDEAERRQQSEQGARDRDVRRLITQSLGEPDFREMVTERFGYEIHSLEWADLGALLPHRQTYEIWIENVEEIAEISVPSAHRLTDRVLAEMKATMLVAVRTKLPIAAATSIVQDEVMVFDDSGDEQGEVRVSALRTVKATFEATFDPDITKMTAVRLRKLTKLRTT